MKKYIPQETFVLRAQVGNHFVYARAPKNFRPDHTDSIEDATKFDERDKLRFPTLIAFRNAVTGLKFETFKIE